MKLLAPLFLFLVSIHLSESAKADFCTPFVECLAVGQTTTEAGWIIYLSHSEPGNGELFIVVKSDTMKSVLIPASAPYEMVEKMRAFDLFGKPVKVEGRLESLAGQGLVTVLSVNKSG